MSERCRIILRCADGIPSKVVAGELGVHEHTVGKWRRRFLKDRLDGLLDEVRPGRPRTIDDDQIAAVIERMLRSTPSDATHWSIRSMAGGHRLFAHDDPPDMERFRPAASSHRDVQAFQRSFVRR
jgi:transposase